MVSWPNWIIRVITYRKEQQRRPFVGLPVWPRWREELSSRDLLGYQWEVYECEIISTSHSQWYYSRAIELEWVEREQGDSVMVWCVRWKQFNLMKIAWWVWVFHTSNANTRWWKGLSCGALGGWGWRLLANICCSASFLEVVPVAPPIDCCSSPMLHVFSELCFGRSESALQTHSDSVQHVLCYL